jgi:hypothetical protein
MALIIKLNRSEYLAFFGLFGLIFTLPNYYQLFVENLFPIIIENSINNASLFKFLYVMILLFITYESYHWIVQLANNIQKTQYLKGDYNFYMVKVVVFGLLGIASAIFLNSWLF